MSKAIDRLGKKVRYEKPVSSITLDELQVYRISHKELLSFVFNKLCTYGKMVDKSSIVTYRIKRFESIISKLKRIETLNLSGMWDIGGCRCILSNNKDVYRLVELLKKDSDLKIKPSVNDYIKKPKQDGYKSIHLYVSSLNSKLTVEVQIRNQKDHNWATLVEITDLLYKAKLKEGNNHPEFSKLHGQLAHFETLTLRDKREVADIISLTKYFAKLCEVFTKNNIPVRKQWLENAAKGGSYFLIETSEDGQSKLRSFPNFLLAEETYFETYKNTTSANLVLTHLPKPSFEDLSTAYSNYILTYHSFVDEFYQILESLIIESIENRKILMFIKYWNLYNETIRHHIYQFVIELHELAEGGTRNKRGKITARTGEWELDIIKKLNNRKNRADKFGNKLREKLPSNLFWKYAFTRIISQISRANEKKFQKMLNQLNEARLASKDKASLPVN